MSIELDSNEEVRLLCALSRSIKERISWIRMWDIHKKSPYYMDKIPRHVKKAREDIQLFKKISGDNYMNMLEILILH